MKPDARRAAILATVITVLVAVARTAADGHKPSVRIGLGGVLLGVFLTGLAEAAPALGRSFSRLVLLSAVFVAGDTVWPTLSRTLQRPEVETP